MLNSHISIQRLSSIAGDERALLSILREADEDDKRVLAVLRDGSLSCYAAYELGSQKPIGAALVRWDDESEIIYVAVVAHHRGFGVGRAIIVTLMQEAAERDVKDLLVGTDNASLGNIAFYQKCGFRMSHVRRGYFSYLNPAPISNGIKIQDMLVFNYSPIPTQ